MLEPTTFNNLRLFKDIVELRSVSKAASANQISQSAASQQLNEVERRLGAELLDRRTRPLTVKPAGRLYYELCKEVLRRVDSFESQLTQIKSEVEGAVRVCSIYSVLTELTQIQDAYRQRYPRCRFQVEYLRPDKVYEEVLSDRADVGIISYPNPKRNVRIIPWRNEVMQVVVSASHPFRTRTLLEPEDLEGQRFVAFDDDIPIRREIDRFLRETGVTIDIVMHFDNIEMVKGAVELGRGISILPRPAVEVEIAQHRLVAIPIRANLMRPLAVIHNKKKEFNQATLRFLELMRETQGGTFVEGPGGVMPAPETFLRANGH